MELGVNLLVCLLVELVKLAKSVFEILFGVMHLFNQVFSGSIQFYVGAFKLSVVLVQSYVCLLLGDMVFLMQFVVMLHNLLVTVENLLEFFILLALLPLVIIYF